MKKQPSKIIISSPSLNHDFEKFMETKHDLTDTIEWIENNIPKDILEQLLYLVK